MDITDNVNEKNDEMGSFAEIITKRMGEISPDEPVDVIGYKLGTVLQEAFKNKEMIELFKESSEQLANASGDMMKSLQHYEEVTYGNGFTDEQKKEVRDDTLRALHRMGLYTNNANDMFESIRQDSATKSLFGNYANDRVMEYAMDTLTKDDVAYKNYSEFQNVLDKANEPIRQVWKKSYEVMMDIEHNRLENSYEKFYNLIVKEEARLKQSFEEKNPGIPYTREGILQSNPENAEKFRKIEDIMRNRTRAYDMVNVSLVKACQLAQENNFGNNEAFNRNVQLLQSSMDWQKKISEVGILGDMFARSVRPIQYNYFDNKYQIGDVKQDVSKNELVQTYGKGSSLVEVQAIDKVKNMVNMHLNYQYENDILKGPVASIPEQDTRDNTVILLSEFEQKYKENKEAQQQFKKFMETQYLAGNHNVDIPLSGKENLESVDFMVRKIDMAKATQKLMEDRQKILDDIEKQRTEIENDIKELKKKQEERDKRFFGLGKLFGDDKRTENQEQQKELRKKLEEVMKDIKKGTKWIPFPYINMNNQLLSAEMYASSVPQQKEQTTEKTAERKGFTFEQERKSLSVDKSVKHDSLEKNI